MLIVKVEAVHRKYPIQIEESDRKRLPAALLEILPEGDWLVTVEPAGEERGFRDHGSFLRGYAPEDEGLYDDLAATG
jgi:hypothetical protein